MGSTMSPANIDLRADEEILADLQTHKPVDPNSERNIWAFVSRIEVLVPLIPVSRKDFLSLMGLLTF